MKTGIFQTALLVICGVVITVAVLMFSGVLPGLNLGGAKAVPAVIVWGSLPEVPMRQMMENLNKDYPESFRATYVFKNAETIEAEFVDALARGAGPDAVLITEDFAVKQANKLYPIPDTLLSIRDFRDTYAEVGEVYLSPQGGILALPLYIDPLVMYYNRDFYGNAGIATIPLTWSGIIKNHNAFTKLGERGVILQSGLAFGTANNVANINAILSLLFLQAGNRLAVWNSTTAKYSADLLGSNSSDRLSPGAAALDFYTAFANPITITYSWNESMPLDKSYFSAGKLAHYLGFASELAELRNRNPNLNLDVVLVPQRDNVAKKKTFARLTAVALVKNSRNLNAAYQLASALASAKYDAELAQLASASPARRDLLDLPVTDPFQTVFNKSALASVTWLNPGRAETKAVFAEIIRTKNLGRMASALILLEATEKMNIIYSRF
ncbi:MAG: hypothetical protein A2571_02050 [Candidatus Vogelbacteria bacterium RIFOXYD1_FULL_44_32]|uniref:ABC transporter substrate-binding protein n=1 Tax=Candidatus Vogelbacteria bacterium RIFOXYD1_FULL_44_32 TaxID=1802438 RepID=A0A1G2QD95_9BACT|nr:MAG: hypothetical protein A2571_02050 [Candidatus Vogelbacteria bacterium RIFOXYD1_FULL_44_32]